MVTVLDYGLGNVRSFVNVFNALNVKVTIAKNRESLRSSDRIILPGVGSFDWAMERLEMSGMRDCLDDLVLGQGVPILGICVGMQIMFKGSDEGVKSGLGWIDSRVEHISGDSDAAKVLVPHMGWNDVEPLSHDGLFSELDDPRFYFLHTYCFRKVSQDFTLATADYGGNFSCAVGRGNIHGVQFHPEKSHHWGVKLLKNFVGI